MSPKTKLYVNLVAVLVLGMVMVTWVLTRVAGTELLRPPFRVTVDLASSGGVFTNQEVTYRGVLVGQVGSLELNETGVDLELLIDPEWEGKIPSDIAATVRSKSAVGEQFVNLTPLSESGEPLADGDVIPRERTSLPVDFQELLASLDRVLADVPPGEARSVVRSLAGGVGGKGPEISRILRSLGTLADAFADVAPEQQRLLDSATVTGEAFLASKEEFAAAIKAADEVFAGLGDEPEELKAFLGNNDRLAREAIDLLNRRGAHLQRGITALADFTEFQLEEKDTVLQGLKWTPRFLKAIEEASVPWVSPDGRSFYRIRGGLVLDNVRSSWPCKYAALPFEYERHYFLRSERKEIPKATRCVPSSAPRASRMLLDALEVWYLDALAEQTAEPEDGAEPIGGGTEPDLRLPDEPEGSTEDSTEDSWLGQWLGVQDLEPEATDTWIDPGFPGGLSLP